VRARLPPARPARGGLIALLAIASAIAALPVATLAAGAAAPADVVLRGGAVHTMDASRTRAQAIAVDDGRIAAVGSDAEIAAWIGPATEVVELGGRMVLPGFHDSHIHPIEGGLQALSCALDQARSVDAILARVRECAAARPADTSASDTAAASERGTAASTTSDWLIGGGWDLSLFPAANPNRSLLDGVVSDRPVFLTGADGHSAWVNSKALAIAGIDRSTTDPPRGVIERDAGGEPSGTLRESAMALVSSRLPPPSEASRRAALRHALAVAASFGITAMIDPVADAEDLATYRAAEAAGELNVHVLACAQPLGRGVAEIGGQAQRDSADLAPRGLEAIEQLRAGVSTTTSHGDSRISTGCLKIFVDGVLEGETAALLEPYLDSGQTGMLKVEPKALAEAVTRWDAAGLQVHFHSIGDRAVRTALDAIEAARRANGPLDHRHHIAHLQLVDPSDVPRFATLDATANFQALWAFPDSYIRDVNLGQVGPQRVSRMYPIGSIHRAGGRIAAGSDWPVSSMNPLLAIEVALTREDPERHDLAADAAATLNAGERVDLDTMLAAFTIQGAWLMRQEAADGSIEVGKRADLVVLARDLAAIPPSEIGEVRVERTLVEGQTVFRRAE
jgi:predicted amidohydrolase YtcJ